MALGGDPWFEPLGVQRRQRGDDRRRSVVDVVDRERHDDGRYDGGPDDRRRHDRRRDDGLDERAGDVDGARDDDGPGDDDGAGLDGRHVPGLDERREDIALLARHMLKKTAARDPEFRAQFCENGEPRVSAELIRALTQHAFSTHVRELDGLLMRAAGSSRGREIELSKEARAILKPVARPSQRELGADEIRAALARHGGVKDKAWRELGLASRHALHRLMKKLNIDD